MKERTNDLPTLHGGRIGAMQTTYYDMCEREFINHTMFSKHPSRVESDQTFCKKEDFEQTIER